MSLLPADYALVKPRRSSGLASANALLDSGAVVLVDLAQVAEGALQHGMRIAALPRARDPRQYSGDLYFAFGYPDHLLGQGLLAHHDGEDEARGP